MGLKLVTPPAAMPVTLPEAKAQCGIHASDSEYDAQLNGYIASATSVLDGPRGMLGWAIMPQTWELSLDAFTGTIEFPLGPVTDVTSVKYFDGDGNEQTADPDSYSLDLVGYRQWIVLNAGASWPATLDGVNAVTVRFVAALGEQDLPAIKQAILAQVDHGFQPIGPNNTVQQFERMDWSLIGPKRRIVL